MRKIKESPSENSIFKDFDFMDGREEELRYTRELNEMVYQNMKKMMGYESPREDSNDRKKYGKNRHFKKGGRRNGNYKDARPRSRHENEA